MPHSWMQAATPSGASSTSAPSAASTSALPHLEEAARFPCLATRAPAAAVTIAAAATSVDQSIERHFHPRSPRPQGLGGARDLVRGLALHPQRDEQRRDQR